MAFFIWWSFPIEYQLYPTGSNRIDWHVDTAPFAPNAIEGVLTLCKSSKNTFSYLEKNKEKIVVPVPNQLLLVRPNRYLCKVTPI